MHFIAGNQIAIVKLVTINPRKNCVRKRLKVSTTTECLKITEKVSFNIASEASYVYILSGQKFNKNAKIKKKLDLKGFKCMTVSLDVFGNFLILFETFKYKKPI